MQHGRAWITRIEWRLCVLWFMMACVQSHAADQPSHAADLQSHAANLQSASDPTVSVPHPFPRLLLPLPLGEGGGEGTEPRSSAPADRQHPVPHSAHFIEGYNGAASWRPLVFSYAAHTESGGAFYASNMLGFCQGFEETRTLARDEPLEGDAHQRAQALQGLTGRCQDFVASDFQQQDQLRSDPHDPMFEAGRQLQAARDAFGKDPAARTQLLQALGSAMAARDPLLIDSLGQRLITYRDPRTGRIAFFFDGVPYPLGQSPDIGLALHLVPCELGLQCDSNEPRAQLRCASGAGCEGGRVNEVQTMLAGKPQEFEQVKALARSMADAIVRGDAAAFMPR